MKMKLNGKPVELEARTVLELLQAKEIEPQMVAVELNEKMIDREQFGKTALQENDQIELHYFMGGGGADIQAPFRSIRSATIQGFNRSGGRDAGRPRSDRKRIDVDDGSTQA